MDKQESVTRYAHWGESYRIFLKRKRDNDEPCQLRLKLPKDLALRFETVEAEFYEVYREIHKLYWEKYPK